MHVLLIRLRKARQQTAPVRFVRALVLPLRAVQFLAGHRRLWPLVVGPALINMALFAGMLVLVLTQADVVMDWLWARPGGETIGGELLLGLWYVAYMLALGLGIVVAYVLVLLVGGIVASPFHDALSERTEQLLMGRDDVPALGETFLGGALKSMVSSALVAGLYVALMAPVLLLNLVPGFGSLAATLLGVGLGAFFLALEYTDAMLVRYGYGLRRKLRLLRRHLALVAGFGLGTSLLLWIPLLNFLVMPVAVIGGTALGLGLIDREGSGADRALSSAEDRFQP